MGNSLDDKTLEAIAELICGDDGPVYRRGWELPIFFRNAGLACPDHDGSTRKWWALERLKEYNCDFGEIAKVITRLGNPKEYASKPRVVREAIDRLNSILIIEGFELELKGAHPFLKNVAPSVPEAMPRSTLKLEPNPDFAAITKDPALAPFLDNRWEEVSKCTVAEAHLSAIILMGSILEGVLLALVHDNPSDANKAPSAPKDKAGRVKPFSEWTLTHLINVAHDCSWIQLDAKKFSLVLREYRNLVHPWEQRARGETPDEDTVRICWVVTRAVIKDIEEFKGI